MTVPQLNGSNARADLGGAVTVQAPGLRGTVERLPVAQVGTRAPSPTPATPALVDALTDSGFATVHALSVALQPIPGAAGQTVRAPGGHDGMVVSLPATGAGEAQVAMLTDESGITTWHFPEPVPAEQGRERFVVPVRVEPPAPGAATERGLVAVVGHKLLSVLVYKVVDALIGKAAEAVAAHWEASSRPHALRPFTPADYTTPYPPDGTPLAWDVLSKGRALLFVHGTFSSSHGGFGALKPETLAALHATYGGRVLAFDHPTLSVTPQDNVDALLGLVPAGLHLDLDVVSHSRGGLVARAMAGAGHAKAAPYDVSRIVFVATPNGGTKLADPERLVAFLNRYTTLLNVVPDGPWSVVTDTLNGILTALKVVGHAAVGALPGLDAMNPTNTSLAALGAGLTSDQLFGISSDFEVPAGLRLLVRAADATVDQVFEQDANDLVVPSAGVCDPGAGDGFPILEGSSFAYDLSCGIWHCHYFSEDEVNARLLTWMDGGSDAQ